MQIKMIRSYYIGDRMAKNLNNWPPPKANENKEQPELSYIIRGNIK